MPKLKHSGTGSPDIKKRSEKVITNVEQLIDYPLYLKALICPRHGLILFCQFAIFPTAATPFSGTSIVPMSNSLRLRSASPITATHTSPLRCNPSRAMQFPLQDRIQNSTSTISPEPTVVFVILVQKSSYNLPKDRYLPAV